MIILIKFILYIQVNENGVISFNHPYNVRTPLSLPLIGTQQIIAPYWADVDTRGTGEIFYRQSTDPSLLARASREIRRDFSLIYNIKHLLIVTWNAVGYFRKHVDKVCYQANINEYSYKPKNNSIHLLYSTTYLPQFAIQQKIVLESLTISCLIYPFILPSYLL